MNPLEELERMAFNAAQEQEPDSEVAPAEIARWQKLFSYTYQQADDLIKQHTQDYARTHLSDEHWKMVRTELEAQGYDRNAYEHENSIGGKRIHSSPKSCISAK
jgi:hypothetical protein